MEQLNCSRCLAQLQPEDKLCPQCHALVHAAALEALRARASEAELHQQWQAARQAWTAALALLPPEAKQAQWIEDKLAQLRQKAASQPGAPPAEQHPWARRLGPLAPLAILLAKGKTLFFAIFKLKFLLSFAAFLGVYWALFGAWFGLGFATMILIHEMGHYVEIKRRGLPVEMPVFLPGLGAFVQWQALGVTATVRALVSLAGPAAGLAASLGAAVVYWRTGDPLWAALAHTGAWLNLLNLLPVWILDGAGASLAVDKLGRFSLLLFCGVLLWWTHEAVLLFLGLGFVWQLYRERSAPEGSMPVQLYYSALLAALAWLLHVTPVVRP
jgi:Zn-dependent protease